MYTSGKALLPFALGQLQSLTVLLFSGSVKDCFSLTKPVSVLYAEPIAQLQAIKLQYRRITGHSWGCHNFIDVSMMAHW